MTTMSHDSIMAVVENLTNTTHFIAIKFTHKTYDIKNIFMKEIFRLHGLPKAIISDRDIKFTSNLWKGFFKYLGTQLNFSMTYNPQTYGQIERVNQVLEDMLRMYVMDKPSKWDDYLHLVEFSYNNGHQASLVMSLFEDLYNKKCKTLVSWKN